MKIFYVNQFAGEDAKLFEELVSSEIKKNNEIWFLGPTNSEYLGDKNNEKFVKKIWSDNDYVLKIFNFVKKEKPDIVFFNFEIRNFGSLKAAIRFPLLLLLLKSKTKTAVTMHQIFINKNNGKWEFLEEHDLVKIPLFLLKIFIKLFVKANCNLTNKTIVLSKSAKQGLVEFFHVQKEKIIVSNLAMDNKIIPENKRNENEILQEFKGKKIILCFGAIAPRKGLEYAILSFNKIKDKMSEHVLVIAGSEIEHYKNYKDELINIINKHDLKNRVIFTGNISIEKVNTLFRISDMVIYSNLPYSGGSYAIFHAIHHKKPIIATKIDAFTDVLSKEMALFVNTKNSEEISNAILKLYLEPGLKDELIHAIAKVSNKYSWHYVALEHMRIFQSIKDNVK